MNRDNRLLMTGFAVALLAALFFGLLAHAVMRGETEGFDQKIRGVIHSWATPVLTRTMRGVTELGAPDILITIAIILVWRLLATSRPRAAVVFAIAAVGAEIWDQTLKYFFRRPRPEVYFGFPQPHSYSFPSGHSVESCCFYGVLAAILSVTVRSYVRKAAIWAAAALLTLAIGFSRIYLGVHYPTDVMGGYAVAVVWAAVVRAGYQVWLHRRARPSIS